MTSSNGSLGRRCLAEGFGTFALVFAGCGAIVVDSERGGTLGATGIAATFGLAVMVMVSRPWPGRWSARFSTAWCVNPRRSRVRRRQDTRVDRPTHSMQAAAPE